MADKSHKTVEPVPPDGMEILFFYKCPFCERHIALPSPTSPRMLNCDGCHHQFPIIPVEEDGIHYIRIMLRDGKAAADPDFF